jgi:hypothetical protein
MRTSMKSSPKRRGFTCSGAYVIAHVSAVVWLKARTNPAMVSSDTLARRQRDARGFDAELSSAGKRVQRHVPLSPTLRGADARRRSKQRLQLRPIVW